uniref:Uncharacterized protein n=1 Tax=Macrostomum lignano TaxID=282301 RepID=A0A1I8FL88_9PLAT
MATSDCELTVESLQASTAAAAALCCLR